MALDLTLSSVLCPQKPSQRSLSASALRFAGSEMLR